MAGKSVTVVTGNATKFSEMAEALSRHGITAERRALEIPEIQSLDARAVIADKARQALADVNGPVLVDDSGIYFDTYENFPGTFSKQLFQSIGFPGIFKLADPGTGASFRCYVAFLAPGMAEPTIFHGQYHGRLIARSDDDRRDYDMPYALIFQPDGETKPMAGMTPQERSKDHRHQALDAFAKWYASQ